MELVQITHDSSSWLFNPLRVDDVTAREQPNEIRKRNDVPAFRDNTFAFVGSHMPDYEKIRRESSWQAIWSEPDGLPDGRPAWLLSVLPPSMQSIRIRMASWSFINATDIGCKLSAASELVAVGPDILSMPATVNDEDEDQMTS